MLKLDFIDNATNDFSPLASQVYEMFCNKLKTMSIAGTEKNVKRKGISIVYNCNYRWYKKGGSAGMSEKNILS